MRKCRSNLIRYGAAFVVSGCLLAGSVFPALAESSVSGATMRLSSREGDVIVKGKGGKVIEAFDNMRLQSGYSLETGAASYAGLALDDTKAVKMDALSKGEIRKKGKELELLLSAGSILCDVTAPLESDETLSIRTSTMITGIRGTVVYAEVLDNAATRISVLEGQVWVQSANSGAEGENGRYVSQGQQALVQDSGSQGTGGIEISSLEIDDVAPYVLWEVCENENLANRLGAAGWDVNWIQENAERLLGEKEEENLRRLQEALKALESDRGEKGVQNPLFEGVESDSDSESETERDNIELTLPVDLPTLQNYLRTSDVVLQGNPANDPFTIGGSLTVPAGARMEVEAGVEVLVEDQGSLQVDGTLVIDGKLSNRGTITNTSMNTLDIKGDFFGSGDLVNSGRMLVGGSFVQEAGSFKNSGQGYLQVEGDGRVDSIKLEFGSGATTFNSDLMIMQIDGEIADNLTVEGQLILVTSDIIINRGTYKGGISLDRSKLEIKGGKVSSGEQAYVIAQESPQADTVITLSGGSVLAEEGAAAAVDMDGGEITIKSGVLQVADESIPFVTGSGILKMGEAEYEDEDWGDLIYESQQEDGVWVLTGVRFSGIRSVRMGRSVMAQLPVNTPPALPGEEEMEDGKTPAEGENGAEPGEEGSQPGGSKPGEGGSQPEGSNPGEGGSQPEGSKPGEEGSQSEGSKPGEGGSQSEGTKPGEGGSQPEGTKPGEGGSQPEGTKPGEGGSQPEGTKPGEGGSQPEGTKPGEGGSQPEGTKPGEGGSQPEGTKPGEGGSQPEGTKPGEGGSQPEGTKPGEGGSQPEGTKPSQGGSQPEGTKPSQGGSQPEGTKPSQGGSQPEGTKPGEGSSQPEGTKPGEGDEEPEGDAL